MVVDWILDIPFGVLEWLISFLPEVEPIADFSGGVGAFLGFMDFIMPITVFVDGLLIIVAAFQLAMLRAGMRAVFAR